MIDRELAEVRFRTLAGGRRKTRRPGLGHPVLGDPQPVLRVNGWQRSIVAKNLREPVPRDHVQDILVKEAQLRARSVSLSDNDDARNRVVQVHRTYRIVRRAL